jgi:hypothetical protein
MTAGWLGPIQKIVCPLQLMMKRSEIQKKITAGRYYATLSRRVCANKDYYSKSSALRNLGNETESSIANCQKSNFPVFLKLDFSMKVSHINPS